MLIHFPIEEEKGETEQSNYPVALETGGDNRRGDGSKRGETRGESGLSKVDSAEEEHEEGAEGDYFTTMTQKT